jgi:hypothetical protein
VVAGQWQGATSELTGATGRAPGKAVGGGAHSSGGVAWRWWRMLRAAAFNGGEAAPVMDDIDGVALHCQGRREKVRGESSWTRAPDNGRRWRCSGKNQRGGGVSRGGSRRGGRIGG